MVAITYIYDRQMTCAIVTINIVFLPENPPECFGTNEYPLPPTPPNTSTTRRNCISSISQQRIVISCAVVVVVTGIMFVDNLICGCETDPFCCFCRAQVSPVIRVFSDKYYTYYIYREEGRWIARRMMLYMVALVNVQPSRLLDPPSFVFRCSANE